MKSFGKNTGFQLFILSGSNYLGKFYDIIKSVLNGNQKSLFKLSF